VSLQQQQQQDLADAAVYDVDLVDGFVAVDDDFAGTEDEADDVHAQLTHEVDRNVLEQRHLTRPTVA